MKNSIAASNESNYFLIFLINCLLILIPQTFHLCSISFMQLRGSCWTILRQKFETYWELNQNIEFDVLGSEFLLFGEIDYKLLIGTTIEFVGCQIHSNVPPIQKKKQFTGEKNLVTSKSPFYPFQSWVKEKLLMKNVFGTKIWIIWFLLLELNDSFDSLWLQ